MGFVVDRGKQFLLRMLADDRWISLLEINLVIRYFTEKEIKFSHHQVMIEDLEVAFRP